MGYRKIENEVPISEKMLLTIPEAAAYSNIGINRIDALCKDEGRQFVLYCGNRRLIKRKEFEDYIGKCFEI